LFRGFECWSTLISRWGLTKSRSTLLMPVNVFFDYIINALYNFKLHCRYTFFLLIGEGTLTEEIRWICHSKSRKQYDLNHSVFRILSERISTVNSVSLIIKTIKNYPINHQINSQRTLLFYYKHVWNKYYFYSITEIFDNLLFHYSSSSELSYIP
jgi:hypothetical protein